MRMQLVHGPVETSWTRVAILSGLISHNPYATTRVRSSTGGRARARARLEKLGRMVARVYRAARCPARGIPVRADRRPALFYGLIVAGTVPDLLVAATCCSTYSAPVASRSVPSISGAKREEKSQRSIHE